MKAKTTQSKNKKGGLRLKSQKLRAKILSSYYGNPIKDMKLIAITGTTGKTTVAHYIYEILRSAGKQVAVLASDKPFKTSMLHKFFSDAWKANADYVIVTVPEKSLQEQVFYNLPIHIAVMTNFVTSSLSDMTPEEYLNNEKILFNMHPEIIILNHDDPNYSVFSEFKGNKATYDFGQSGNHVKILNSKLYRHGTEASLSINSKIISVATFIPGEITVSYMAAATTIAHALNLEVKHTIDGIANYQPDQL